MDQKQSPYDFIMRENPPPKRQLNLGNSMAARIALIVGGLTILIILFVVAASFLSSAGNAQKQRLLEAAQAQTEIIRITELGEDQASDLAVRSLAITIRLSLATQQQDLKAALIKRGLKEKSISRSLGLGKNEKTDAALEEASANNRFDDTFLEILNKQLADYKRLLQNAGSGGNKVELQSLKNAISSVENVQKSNLLQSPTTSTN